MPDGIGPLLYISNRVDGVANGSIGVYSIGNDGTLTSGEYQDTGGKTPRHFSLSPDGKLLVVTNQGSDNIRARFAAAGPDESPGAGRQHADWAERPEPIRSVRRRLQRGIFFFPESRRHRS
jgi:6-phosphogluconolactonase